MTLLAPKQLSSSRDASVCSSLRVSLQKAFKEEKPDDGCPSRWIDMSKLTGSFAQVFDAPKDLDLESSLLWTKQTEDLWLELVKPPRGNTVRAQILAGPSGIGKSHLTFLLAARAYAEGHPVLYIADAGRLYSNSGVNGLLVSVMQRFLDCNGDMFSGQLHNVLTWLEFMNLLDAQKAIVIIDEHGHAYRKIKKETHDPDRVFPLLMPNAYLCHRHVRMVFAGSNQASFECDLNRSYRPSLRFIQPFGEIDATLFVASLDGSKHDLVVHRRFANFVPGEMVLLSQHQIPEEYVKSSRGTMCDKLRQSLNLDDVRLVQTLNDLFRLSSMALGIENLSLLDLGYVYRLGSVNTSPLASPLCYPATLALLQLWHDISIVPSKPSKRLVDVALGEDFEQLAWDVLLSRGFGSNAILNGLPLGYDVNNPSAHVTVSRFSFNEYFISNVSAPNQGQGRDILKLEIGGLVMRSRSLGVNILYKCPKGCKAFDFAVLQANGEHVVIQVSLSDLVTHSANNKEPSQKTFSDDFGLSATRYLYITKSPDPHQGIVNGVNRKDKKYDRWNGHDTFIRIVNASEWIGI